MAKTLFGDEILRSPKTVFGDPIKPSGDAFEGLTPIGEDDKFTLPILETSTDPKSLPFEGQDLQVGVDFSLADLAQAGKDIPGQIVGGTLEQVVGGAGHVLQRQFETAEAMKGKGRGRLTPTGADPWQFIRNISMLFGGSERVAAAGKAWGDAWKSYVQEHDWLAQKDYNWIENPVARASQTIWRGAAPSAAAAVAITLLTGSPAVGLVLLGELTGAQTFATERERGVPVTSAYNRSVIDEAAEIGGEMLVFPKFFRGGLSLARFTALLAEQAGQEGVTGFIQAFRDAFSRARDEGVETREAAKLAFNEGVKAVPEDMLAGMGGAFIFGAGGAIKQGRVEKKRSLLASINAQVEKKSPIGITERVKTKIPEFFAQKKVPTVKPVADASTKKTIKEKDKIVSPKVKLTTASRLKSTGEVFVKEGALHHETQMLAEAKKLSVPLQEIEDRIAAGELELLNDLDVEHGFVTETGEFIDRDAAGELAGVAHIPGKFDALDLGLTSQEVLARRLEVQKDIVAKGKKAAEAFDNLTEKEQDEKVVSKTSNFEIDDAKARDAQVAKRASELEKFKNLERGQHEVSGEVHQAFQDYHAAVQDRQEIVKEFDMGIGDWTQDDVDAARRHEKVMIEKLNKVWQEDDIEQLTELQPLLEADTGQLSPDIAPKTDIGIETPSVEKPATTSELMDQLAEVDKRISEVEQLEQLFKKERNKALKRAHGLASDMYMDDETFKKFKRTSVGKESMSDMTPEEMRLLNLDLAQYRKYLRDPVEKLNDTIKRLGMTETEHFKLRKAARADETVVGKVLKSVEQLGGFSNVPAERSYQMRLFTEWARDIANWEKKNITRKRPKAILNPIVSSRHALGSAEQRTGVLFAQLAISIADHANTGKTKGLNEFILKMKEAGRKVTTLKKVLINEELLVDYLHSETIKGRKEAFEKIDFYNQGVAKAISEMLDQNSATGNALRRMRWVRLNNLETQIETILNKAKLTKADKKHLKKLRTFRSDILIPDAPDNVILLGREQKDLGTFDEWVNSQTWGTRRFYGLNEKQLTEIVDSMFEPTVPGDLRLTSPVGKKVSGVIPSETFARKEKGKRLTKPVLQSVLSHMTRIQSAAAIQEEVYELQDRLRDIELTEKDLRRLNRYIDNLTGVPQDVGILTEATEWSNRLFWKTFPLQAARIDHYIVRNLLQNIANAPSQMAYKEFVFAAKAIYSKGRANPLLAEAMEKWSEISEKAPMQTEFMLMDRSGFVADPVLPWLPEIQFRIAMSVDAAGKLIPFSDEINRRLIFPVFHQAMYNNIKRYQRTGNIGTFRRNLELDTLRGFQKRELLQHLKDKAYAELTFKYAKYKTENVHYKYRTSGRSFSEQHRAEKSLMGLIVFPRGTAELAWYSGLKPLLRGLKTGSPNQTYQGMKSLAKLSIGWRIASIAALTLMGRRWKEDYNLIGTIQGYSPGSVGFQKLIGAFQNNLNAWGQTIEKYGYTVQAAEMIAQSAIKTIEFSVPLVDVFINQAELTDDVGSLNFYRLIRTKMNERYLFEHGVRLPHFDRDTREKIQHLLFGSEETKQPIRDLNLLSEESIEAFLDLSPQEQGVYLITGYWPQ